jgi:hypothetical protein
MSARMTDTSSPFPWPDARVARYTAYRTPEPLTIDGKLDEPSWARAPRSPRFVDLITGRPTIHDTRAAVLWDDDYLYVGYWVEEPFVAATLTERDSLVWTENDIELFVAGHDGYYELEINPLGTIYEAAFLWEDAYMRGGYDKRLEFSRDADGFKPWNGVGFTTHPRGPRLGFFKWDLPGLRSGVSVDGTVNDNSDRDRGWTAEIALPWSSLDWLAKGDGRTVPPRDGDTWRMDFSRFNQYKEAAPANDSGGWAWNAHGVWDSHIPELFPYIEFSDKTV